MQALFTVVRRRNDLVLKLFATINELASDKNPVEACRLASTDMKKSLDSIRHQIEGGTIFNSIYSLNSNDKNLSVDQQTMLASFEKKPQFISMHISAMDDSMEGRPLKLPPGMYEFVEACVTAKMMIDQGIDL